MPAEKQQLRPDLFFEFVWGYQRTGALKAAIELDLFTAIGEGAETPADLAKQVKASERGTRILCDYLAVAGFLTKQKGRYRLTPDSATFLDRRSPACIGSTAAFLTSPMLREAFADVAAAVRKGGTVLGEEGTVAPEHPVWVEFARAMAPLAAMSAELISKLLKAESAGEWKVLDIAAGHGLYGITLARHNPKATVTAVDWPNVLALAEENARAAGVADRWTRRPGSAFAVEFGAGYDLVLVTNFLHHFDPPTCEKFLRRVHASLKPGGLAVTLEFVPNPDRVSPARAAQFSLIMLCSTPSGDAYTFAELEAMARNAGFARSQLHPLPPTDQSVVLSYR
ncbi:MAG: methyltransferase domain-containing protein [Candidatus Acidiferrales bacterium]